MMPSHLEQESYHTYIVFDVGAEEKEKYELKILQKHQLNGFLPFQLRSRDGNDCYYYEVPTDQTMEKSLKKGIHARQIRDFSRGLMEALEVAAEYLMDENDIVLVPEYIYIDRKGRYQFLLFPGYKTDLSASLRDVAASFLKAVDYKDRASVQEVYEYYHLMCAGKSTLRALREYVFIGPGRLPDGMSETDDSRAQTGPCEAGGPQGLRGRPETEAGAAEQSGWSHTGVAQDQRGWYGAGGSSVMPERSSRLNAGDVNVRGGWQSVDGSPGTAEQSNRPNAGGVNARGGWQSVDGSSGAAEQSSRPDAGGMNARRGWRSVEGSPGAAEQSGWSHTGVAQDQRGWCGAGGSSVMPERSSRLNAGDVNVRGGWQSVDGSSGTAEQSSWSHVGIGQAWRETRDADDLRKKKRKDIRHQPNAGAGHDGNTQGSQEEQDTSRMGGYLILAALLCAELAAGFVCRKLFYQLPVKFLILICAVVMAATFVVGWRILRNQMDEEDMPSEETRDHPVKNSHKKDEFWNSSDFISYDYIDPKTTLLNAHPRGLLLKSADIQICQDLHISEFPSVIGKDAADVRCKIPVSTVSRRHARLEALGMDYYLTDLHSSNGTFMNGEPLRPMTPKKIHMGDSIMFSNVSFTVMEDAG